MEAQSIRYLPSLVCTCWVGCLWLLPACFVLSGSFLWPSAVPTCLAGRLRLLLACIVLFSSFLAVSCLYLLGGVFLAVAYLFCPVRLVSGRLRFLPAWLGVSGC